MDINGMSLKTNPSCTYVRAAAIS